MKNKPANVVPGGLTIGHNMAPRKPIISPAIGRRLTLRGSSRTGRPVRRSAHLPSWNR